MARTKPVVYRGNSNNGVMTVLAGWKHDFLKAKVTLAMIVGWDEAHRLMPEPTTGTATFVSIERFERDPEAGYTGDITDMASWMQGCEVRTSEVGNYVPFSNQFDTDIVWAMTPEMIRVMFGLDEVPQRPSPAIL